MHDALQPHWHRVFVADLGEGLEKPLQVSTSILALIVVKHSSRCLPGSHFSLQSNMELYVLTGVDRDCRQPDPDQHHTMLLDCKVSHHKQCHEPVCLGA